jgi:hypothetical protein
LPNGVESVALNHGNNLALASIAGAKKE